MTERGRPTRTTRNQPVWPCAPKLAQALIAAALWNPFPLSHAHGQMITSGEVQSENPVFVDESAVAVETVAAARRDLASGNFDNALAQLQRILDQRSDNVIKVEGQDRLYWSVRQTVQNLIASSPAATARYRDREEAAAKDLIASGDLRAAARSRFLTTSGLEAQLKLARAAALAGHGNSALLLLRECAGHRDLEAFRAELAEIFQLASQTHPEPWFARSVGETLRLAPSAEIDPPAIASPASKPVASDTSILIGTSVAPIDDLVPKPISSAPFREDLSLFDPTFRSQVVPVEKMPPYARELRIWPAVSSAGTIVIQANGVVQGFDRLSLSSAWSIDPVALLGGARRPLPEEEGFFASRLRRARFFDFEEPESVLAVNPLVLAVISRDLGGSEGPELIVAIDARSGQLRWSKPVADLSPELVNAFSRGPMIEESGTVVLNLSKGDTTRRLVAGYMVGFDPFTGQTKWTRLVGSAGALPFFRAQRQVADGAAASAGIIFRSDRLGVVGAYAADDGRTIWSRRIPSKLGLDSPAPIDSFFLHTPVIAEDSVFVLSPDRQTILQFDALTGTELSTRPTALVIGAENTQAANERKASAELGFEDPWAIQYLLVSADNKHLIGVSEMRLASWPIADPKAQPAISVRFGEKLPGIRGRVTKAGQYLAVPTADGLSLVLPGDVSKIARSIPLDAPGTALSLPEGLLVADDAFLRVYSTWELASTQLKDLVASNPRDPRPAVDLAILADRAGRSAEVLPAAQAAALAFNQLNAEDPQALVPRARLIEALLNIVSRGPGGKLAPVSTSSNLTTVPATLDESGIDQALSIASEVAKSPRERASVLLVQGSVRERRNQPADAVAIYQSLLAEPILGASPFSSARGAIRSDVEATERLVALVGRSRSAYAIFDEQFERKLADLRTLALPPTSAEIDALASQFPVALGLPKLWLFAADLAFSATQPTQEARMLERGLWAAERIAIAEPALLAELSGRLIANLQARKLSVAAADVLKRADRSIPDQTLTVRGQPIDRASLREQIGAIVAESQRWPTLSALSTQTVQALEGWALVEPAIPSSKGIAPPFFVMASNENNKPSVALFAAKDANAPLEAIWTEQTDQTPWELYRLDPRGATFFIAGKSGGRLLRVDYASAQTKWRTPGFGELFPQDPPLQFGADFDRVTTPLEGERPASELLAATDDRSVILIERSGRAAGFDVDSGNLLFAARTGLSRVTDGDVVGGELILAGAMTTPTGELAHALTVIDARSGNIRTTLPSPVGEIRWLRVGSKGQLIVGGANAVASLLIEQSRPEWRITDSPAANTIDAWLIDDRLFVLTTDRQMFEIAPNSGTVNPVPIETQGKLETSSLVRMSSAPSGQVALRSGRGLVIIGQDGKLAGADSLNAPGDALLTPIAVDGGFVTLTLPPNQREMFEASKVSSYSLFALDSTSASLMWRAELQLGRPPMAIAAIDNRLAVTAGHTTVVYRSTQGK